MFQGGEMSFLISQITSYAPVLLVYLAAIVLAFTYMDRARLPSVLTLIGVAVSIITTILMIGAQTYIMSNRDDASGLRNQMMVVGIMGSIFRAVGLGFFIAAIFVGRNHVPPADRYLHE